VSPRALRWLLWLAALAALPLPLAGIGSALVPPLHQLELGALALAFTISERAQGIGPLASALFLGQALAWALALWLVAGLLARALGRLGPLTRTRVACFLVVLGITLAASLPVYRTPYSAHSARSSLLEVYR
jgi:hypothetical protein